MLAINWVKLAGELSTWRTRRCPEPQAKKWQRAVQLANRSSALLENMLKFWILACRQESFLRKFAESLSDQVDADRVLDVDYP